MVTGTRLIHQEDECPVCVPRTGPSPHFSFGNFIQPNSWQKAVHSVYRYELGEIDDERLAFWTNRVREIESELNGAPPPPNLDWENGVPLKWAFDAEQEAAAGCTRDHVSDDDHSEANTGGVYRINGEEFGSLFDLLVEPDEGSRPWELGARVTATQHRTDILVERTRLNLLSIRDRTELVRALVGSSPRGESPSLDEVNLRSQLLEAQRIVERHGLGDEDDLDDAIVDLDGDSTRRTAVVEALLWAGSISLAAADDGQGKSLLLEGAVVCVTNGWPFAGRVTTSGATLLLDGQLGEEQIRGRIRAFAMPFAGDELPVVVRKPWDITSQAGSLRLRAYIEIAEQRRGMPLRLLVIDSIAEFIGERDLNDHATAEAVYRVLRDIQDEYPELAIVLTLNLRKYAIRGGYANNAKQRAAGSKFWSNLADEVFEIHVYHDDDSLQIARQVVTPKKDRDNHNQMLSIDYVQCENGGLELRQADEERVFTEPPQRGRRPERDWDQEILNALVDGEPHRLSDVIRMLRTSDKTLVQPRARLRETGRITETKDGRYVVMELAKPQPE